MIRSIFDPEVWSRVPFHLWTFFAFTMGAIVGSFLNVCIHRMPIGQSVISPPSHCPQCKYSIPWFLNIPLVTWLYLGGKCKNCSLPIPIRYFLVELLTAITFLGCWLAFGHQSALLAAAYAILLSGLIVATFIDFEHFIIPDEITFGGMVAGFICSIIVPALQHESTVTGAMRKSLIGLAVGAGLIYAILRIGKLLFGRQRISLPPDSRIIFTETALHFADQQIAYEELFYRRSDVIKVHAQTVELVDRCYQNVEVKLSPSRLRIGDEEFNPEEVQHMEAVGSDLVLPREAMGLGDVKFMGAIGAFLGWQSVIFSLLVSSLIGSIVGVGLILLQKRELGSRLPYGPYIALGAVIYVFAGPQLTELFIDVLVGMDSRKTLAVLMFVCAAIAGLVLMRIVRATDPEPEAQKTS